LNDDFRPFLYKTTDYGASWTKIVTGIPEDDFTRAIRPDPKVKGLLFAGTEAHVYISANDGASWSPFQLNLPNVPITDMVFQKRDDELVVATQGRGFYVLDDMPMVRALAALGKLPDEPVHLFAPKETYRYIGGGGFGGGGGGASVGTNPPSGVVVYYSLKSKPASDVVIRVKTEDGKLVNAFSSKPEVKEAEGMEPSEDRRAPTKPTTKAGLNRFVWNLRYADATKFPGMILWGGSTAGPLVVPGTYVIELVADGHTETQKAVVKADPRVSTTAEEYAKQRDLGLQIRDRFSEANQAVIDIRLAKTQLDRYAATAEPKLAAEAKRISGKLTEVEEAIYQTKLRANEDALNFPIKLNNKLAALGSTVGESDTAPTEQSYAVFKELSAGLQVQLDKLKQIDASDVAAFNKLVREQNIPAITISTVK
jgi:hypothetical protein